MSAADLALHTRTTLLALGRRRVTVAILILLPLALYAASHGAVGRSVRSLVFGITWAVSTVSFFTAVSARHLDPRLRLAGRSGPFLVAARLVALSAVALVLVTGFWLVVVVDQPIGSAAAVAVDFGVSALVAVAFGAAVGTVATKEMEGTMILFFFAALQAVVNPFDAVSRALPFWSSRELGTWAVDGSGVGSLTDGLLHAAVVVALCAMVALGLPRLRDGRPPADPVAPGSGP